MSFNLQFFVSLLLLGLFFLAVKNFRKLSFLKWIIVAISISLSSRYLLWRGLFTLNLVSPSAIIASRVLYFAEIYGFLSSFFFYLQTIKSNLSSSVTRDDSFLPTVDIFVPVYNESVDILYKTLVGCLNIDYPKERFNVYVLDDAGRKEVYQLTRTLKCRYLKRETHEYAKAGNLNYGLKNSDGEFIAIFDVDHIPLSSFLKETIGYFKNSWVAFVQTAHHFYNSDIYQRNLFLEGKLTNDQDLFFHVIQPGRNYFNSSFFAGSSGIFKRKALEEINGFQTTTVTEDIHTSLVLHSRGWRSVYVNKDLSAGLTPESISAYLNQRRRWTRGSLQLFIYDNPLFKRGLSLAQRINYFASVFYFFHPLPRIVYLSAPLSFLLFNIPPIKANFLELIHYFFAHYLAFIFAFHLLGKSFRYFFWSDVYETTTAFPLSLEVIKTLIRPKDTVFKVTPKGERSERLKFNSFYLIPNVVLTGLILFGLLRGTYLTLSHLIDWQTAVINLGWSTYNFLLLSLAIMIGIERPQRRLAVRFLRALSCKIISGDRLIPAKTFDLSESGISLIIEERVPFQPTFGLLLSLDREESILFGKTVRYDQYSRGRYLLSFSFVGLTKTQRQNLIKGIFTTPSVWEHFFPNGIWYSFKNLLSVLYKPLRKRKFLRRSAPRLKKVIPTEITSVGKSYFGYTRDLSERGVSLRIKKRVKLIGEFRLKLYWRRGFEEVEGEPVWIRYGKDETLLGIKLKQFIELGSLIS